MNSKMVGGILLVIGTSIGGGMLALPIALAQGGFLGALLLLFGAWALMTFGALLILEVNLWLPQDSNIISMVKHTLGPGSAIIAWAAYLLLLYSLLSAYISGGSGIFGLLLQMIHIHIPRELNALLFVLVWGSVVYIGIELVDYVNRGLMLTKLSALVALLVFIFPHISIAPLYHFNSPYLVSAITIVITSFGFATIVPTLRSYFKGDIKKLRRVIFIGSLIPLSCYIAWIAAIIAEIPLRGKYGLVEMLSSGHSAAALTQSLILFLHNPWVVTFATLFTSICVLTSFLGVSLCLTDFLADGFGKKKKGWDGVLIYGVTFVPPLLMTILDPRIFMVGIRYAGIFCVILLVLFPTIMAWRGRYQQNMIAEYQVCGGKLALSISLFFAVLILGYEVFIDLHIF